MEFFNEDGHLDENGMALCAEFLLYDHPIANEKLRKHFLSCLECRALAAEVAADMKRYENSVGLEKASPDKSNGYRKYLGIGLVSMILLMISLVFGGDISNVFRGKYLSYDLYMESRQTKSPLEDKHQSFVLSNRLFNLPVSFIERNAEDSCLLKKYRKSLYYEGLIEENFQTFYNSRNQPHFNKAFKKGQNVIFQWKHSSISSVRFSMVNAQGALTYSGIFDGNCRHKIYGVMDPGLYYWKLENKNQILFVGRFYVY